MGKQIAIDGPAGAGKSTVAKMIAEKLGYIYVDTGAMYRAMGLYLLRNGIDPLDKKKVSAKCKDVDITIKYELSSFPKLNGEQVIYLNGENVNGLIRTEEISKAASDCSTNPNVRKKLVELQQKLAEDADVVMEGRDIGTCVLPDAQTKIFLTASTWIRAGRRCEELKAKSISCDQHQIAIDIEKRDRQDNTREVSPLRQAADAIKLDSSNMTAEQIVTVIIALSEMEK